MNMHRSADDSSVGAVKARSAPADRVERGMTEIFERAGYSSALFAEVYRNYGRPRPLPACGGTVLVRPIAGTELTDAMGCYPLFCCQRWDRLEEDLAELGRDCVSLVLVADPFAPVGEAGLRRLFDHVILFKHHYVADLSKATRDFVSGKRYRSARSALRRFSVEVTTDARPWVDEWMALQQELDRRHALTGMHRLSREEVALLFETPGVVVFRASHQGETMGMHVEFVENGRAYAHLAAYSADGYHLNVSTALNVYELEYFRGRVDYIDWGGVAGHSDDPENGLGIFKARFSNARIPTFLCGRILDRRVYDELTSRRSKPRDNYFPAYRSGEAL
jgi:hypothetical protein